MNWASASIQSYRYPRRSSTGYASFKSLNTEKEKKNMAKKNVNHRETRIEYFNNTGIGINKKECYICHKASDTFVITDTNFTRIFIGEETVLCTNCAKKLKKIFLYMKMNAK